MYRFYCKMQYVKGRIKHWNKHVFKNIFHQKNCVSKQLHAINEHVIVNGLDSDTILKQKNLQAEWEELCKRKRNSGGRDPENFGLRRVIKI